ncbi:S-layer domain-containing protein [Thalassoporum mexicanum PCC 7367]|uniref:S-layer homology domain-containing protein n=1 Tax=Thalassoporum mexicanum TaxID=3457544 RepID=UPI00029FE9AB|nr:S-layer homology domain-containing protein [Pseudanabaena sp. PCC 7367]AFY71699.1 S-layer domain-containing protein [Pseudanabaena sp. PCC 7367]
MRSPQNLFPETVMRQIVNPRIFTTFALLLAIGSTRAIMPIAAFAQAADPLPPVPTVEVGDPIERVLESGLMSNAADGKFHAERVISRAELATILVDTFNLEQRVTGNNEVVPLKDVPKSHWAYGKIQTVLRTKTMTGYYPGEFYPNQRINRAEAMAIFANAYGVFQFPTETIDRVLAMYPDADQIPTWARKSMATALYEQFVNLDNGGLIKPLEPMTRGDMAYVLSQYLTRLDQTAPLPWSSEEFPQNN